MTTRQKLVVIALYSVFTLFAWLSLSHAGEPSSNPYYKVDKAQSRLERGREQRKEVDSKLRDLSAALGLPTPTPRTSPKPTVEGGK